MTLALPPEEYKASLLDLSAEYLNVHTEAEFE